VLAQTTRHLVAYKSGHHQLFASVARHRYNEISMDDPNENPRRHRWPWLVLAAFLLGVALAILWIRFEVLKVERERDFNAPLPASPAHH
jgi:ferric-dicitrate binding protein FerR (iron transport regulator)